MTDRPAYRALSDKHRAFLDAYLRNGMRREDAAKELGYKRRQTATDILAREDFKAALAEHQDAAIERNDVTTDRVIAEIQMIALLPEPEAGWSPSLLNVKRAACVDLLKLDESGRYAERHDHRHKGSIDIGVHALSDAELERIAIGGRNGAVAPTQGAGKPDGVRKRH